MTKPLSTSGRSRPGTQGDADTVEPTIADTPVGSGNDKIHAAGTAHRRNDRIFKGIATTSAATITVLIAAIGFFLLWRAVPALMNNADGLTGFFTYGGDWNTSDTSAMLFGIPNLLAVTVTVSLVALALAMPIALGVALYLSAYAPERLRKPLGFLVDLLAAVPSIVYGLWGAAVLGPALGGVFEWINAHADSFFLFRHYANSPAFSTSRNVLTGGVVLAIMILPVIAATAREVFVQTPAGHKESALALGATRWEVVKMTVLPFGFSGYISGSMLGLGRALGETMALYLVVSPSSAFRASLFDGGTTFATAIANAAPEFNDNLKAGAYIAAGLVLFLLTFVVNAGARAVIKNRSMS
ncbi:phosphate ABC transporter permease subunit PstC [Corynebacterium meridianum]|uniref:Phosphate transport system permease protein n=1 Tax=Corynebacterium meridianum TaxID=2765363 RepID=A0A934I564_9CORY|nr:phosphate ABC transporter permease subunit PstC [Corynebacterium meridianum]MBI8990416.1 phosphate ABC transporter permease subunit PstC [Corynebacterium meridianum]MCK7678673.1 phosphate ABC transporter permease subunit PstC [Corynebacterium meridianum]